MQTDADTSARGAAPGVSGPCAPAELADYRPGDEAAIVAVLEACQPQGWGTVADWRWKHGGRPGFLAGDVQVARAGGEVVGCFHGAVLTLRLEAGLEVPMSFDGDFAVLPAHRGRGIPRAAHDLTDRRLLARHVALRGGFTSRELNERFYHQQFGYVFVPSLTTQYRRILGPGPLQPRVEALGAALLAARAGLRRALGRRPLIVELRIDDFPDCHLVLAGAGFRLERGAAERPHLVVRAPYAVLAALAGGAGAGVRCAAAQLVRGRLRVGGFVRHAPRLLALVLAALRRR